MAAATNATAPGGTQFSPPSPQQQQQQSGGAGAAAAPRSQFPSLVRYDNPVLVSRVDAAAAATAAMGGVALVGGSGIQASSRRPPGGTAGAAIGTHDASTGSHDGGGGAAGAVAGGAYTGPAHTRKSTGGGDDALPLAGSPASKGISGVGGAGSGNSGVGASPTEDILHSILPPRVWEDGGELWQQKVSSTPATRLDVITLQEQLDMWLQRREARETGICPVRRELYNQCFDELIRQVSISCQERGLLLLRVRDEIRMSIAAYQTLYESSVAFGMRKALMAEWGKSDMETRITELATEKGILETQVAELKAKCDSIEKREAERRAMDERKHAEEIAFMKKTNLQLKTQLEGILAPQKK